MANRGLIIAGAAVLGIGALALFAGEASASEDEPSPRGPMPPPPTRTPPGGGGGGGSTPLTPMQIAKAHPNYNDWLYATQQCDQWIADGMDPDSPFIGFCDDAAHFATVMVNDGVPVGQWR